LTDDGLADVELAGSLGDLESELRIFQAALLGFGGRPTCPCGGDAVVEEGGGRQELDGLPCSNSTPMAPKRVSALRFFQAREHEQACGKSGRRSKRFFGAILGRP